ncbi:MAG: AAA family ATPase [Nitrospirae bacterium]|nr:AAA family ATPase [Nitrospirota bacterium]
MDCLEFYSLRQQPFSNTVETKFYYNSQQHAEAMVRLKYAIDTMKGLAVVVGDIGTGKTTLARKMIDELDETKYESALLVVIHSSITTEWLMRKIAIQIGVQNPASIKSELLGQVYERLTEVYEAGLKPVILIDEVQMLQSREIMEEFRGLLNMDVPEGKLVTFVFFGLPELDEVLSLDEPLRQRIAVKCRLKAYTEDITSDYIRHRLKVAGCDHNVFTEEAIKAIYLYSNGVPRLINTVCDNALLEGYILKKKEIDRGIIESVAVSLGLKIEPTPKVHKEPHAGIL